MADYKKYIIPHSHSLERGNRESLMGHHSKVIWFTGLSGSGKSTLAGGLEEYLHSHGIHTYILDGDNIRTGLNSDLDFSEESRTENIRRISEVSKLFVDAGIVVLSAFISPFKEDRNSAMNLVGRENFLEVYVECPLEVCEERDVKGLYKKARNGEIKNFTGISSPFEEPEDADIVINTANNSMEECLKKLVEKVEPLLQL
ncbi:adenylylsulfate kinase [Ekhidna lutea]|uniref:Adenylyl-sulfate kinase n=1 Tax=Ekhidna lutea TaxID=447679 RepID=A0A239FET8_EKHLU|nr:adenylyl-sulfate kinase [Ekhidna lutea]SNS55540.1 adenylylsulfate kinase [Ekhidna lutea]